MCSGAGACVLHCMWVHACCYCGVYTKCWTLVNFSDIGVHDCHCMCAYTLTAPDPHAHAQPLLPSCPTSTVSSRPGHDYRGGNLPLDCGMGARWWQLRLARGGANSACLLGDRYLHHAPAKPHARPHTLTTLLYPTTFYLPPLFRPHPCTS